MIIGVDNNEGPTFLLGFDCTTIFRTVHYNVVPVLGYGIPHILTFNVANLTNQQLVQRLKSQV